MPRRRLGDAFERISEERRHRIARRARRLIDGELEIAAQRGDGIAHHGDDVFTALLVRTQPGLLELGDAVGGQLERARRSRQRFALHPELAHRGERLALLGRRFRVTRDEGVERAVDALFAAAREVRRQRETAPRTHRQPREPRRHSQPLVGLGGSEAVEQRESRRHGADETHRSREHAGSTGRADLRRPAREPPVAAGLGAYREIRPEPSECVGALICARALVPRTRGARALDPPQCVLGRGDATQHVAQPHDEEPRQQQTTHGREQTPVRHVVPRTAREHHAHGDTHSENRSSHRHPCSIPPFHGASGPEPALVSLVCPSPLGSGSCVTAAPPRHDRLRSPSLRVRRRAA